MSATPLSGDDLALIAAATHWRAHRMEALSLSVGKALIKGQRPVRSTWLYGLMNGIASLFNMPMLKAAPAHGGPAAQAIEVRRLRRLAAAGVAVPEVLHVDGERFVMRFAPGAPVSHTLTRIDTTEAQARDLWLRGAQALADLHAKGQYLSQAFARNMIDSEGQIVFIDFEDDPCDVMSLAHAQARDWLAYLHSTLWLLEARGVDLLLISEHLSQILSAQEHQFLQKTGHQTAWLRHLPTQRKPWGREIIYTQTFAQFLWRFSHRLPISH